MRDYFKKAVGALLIIYTLFVAVFGYFSYKYDNVYKSVASGEVIPIYWNEIEKERGEYDFSASDKRLEEVLKNNATTSLALGFKQRTDSGNAECIFPEWYDHTAPQQTKDKWLFQMLRNAINHYEYNSNITAWQIEQDSFKKQEGCPLPDGELLAAEIVLVEGVDDSGKQIIVDRGEASFSEFKKWIKNWTK